ncbi:aldose 1-epimerase family protein [Tunicatimonas pelagia]|uniref:aldose 1-epimerase family protein n=1 Tax=Tunicatimonas pelagia TaxID=931531 RepID=UPI002665D188|nr:aldose 1-epimerase family protein [Tunicatimonas pelagia]WKN46375.1 aldose 1-epimerase family protein [Tunicatimonas pelagia]
MEEKTSIAPWAGKLSNPAQLGGIETSVLDNGQGRGTRIAWINTGTGLRYKVVLDRAMDIADAFFQQHSLAWLSHGGITPPQASANQGINWLRNFGGGLLTTCGLTHVGGPEKDERGERGLHGRISNTPAEIESIIQPDIATGKMNMSISGRIRETTVFGPSLELYRTISSTIGSSIIRIEDEVINRGNTSAPHMLLYHCNFGWPLVDEGAKLVWRGDWQTPSGEPGRIFRQDNDFCQCPAPLGEHNGTGEDVAFINIQADENGTCTCGIHNPKLNLAVVLRFPKQQLPWLTNWQHWGKGEYVTGLEPGTNPPIGQAQARANNTLIQLEPDESRKYSLEIEVLTEPSGINHFLDNHL